MEPAGSDAESSRERLIAAAREVFLERGYAGVTVSAVARRAGFTTGALYGQFGSKEELLAEAIARAISDEVREHLQRALPGRSSTEAAHVLLVNEVTRPLEAGDVLIMHGLAAALGEGGAVLRPQLMRIVEVIRELLERGRAEGVIDPDVDLDAFLRITAALMFGSVALKMLELPAPDEEALESVIRRFERVFAPRPPQDGA